MTDFLQKIFPRSLRARRNLRAGTLGAALALFCAFPPAIFAENEENSVSADVPAIERFSTTRTEFFSISAESAPAASAVARLAEDVETCALRLPRAWKNRLPAPGRRVAVELFPKSGIFRIAQSRDDGRVTLFLSEDFADDSGCRRTRSRLAAALLAQMFFPENPAENSPKFAVPAWLAAALGEESRIGAVSGRKIYFQKQSAAARPISPRIFLTAGADDFERDELLRLNAVWFLRAVSATAVAPEIFFVPEKSADEWLAAAFPKIFKKSEKSASAGTPPDAEAAGTPPDAAEAFWNVRFFELVAGTPGGIDLPEESQRALDDALIFAVKIGGNERRVLGGDLVVFRLNAEIRALVSARFSELASRWRRVNPVWHNALTEYGVFLEMFGNPGVSDDAVAAQWRKAVLAREDALKLRRDVKNALESASESAVPAREN